MLAANKDERTLSEVPNLTHLVHSAGSATKEKVVSYPAEAFIGVRAIEAKNGSLVFLRGDWALRCWFDGKDEKVQEVLWLTGRNAGQISSVPNELALATAPTVRASIRLSDVTKAKSHYEATPGTAVVSAVGNIELWGHIMGAGPDSVYGFTMTGQNVIPPDNVGFVYFDSYEVWLEQEGVTIGESPLFTVNPA